MKMETEAQWDEVSHTEEDPKLFLLISRLVYFFQYLYFPSF